MQYVFEDVPLDGGWIATVAVIVNDEEAPFALGMMAVDSECKRYVTLTSRSAGVTVDTAQEVRDRVDSWVSAQADIPWLHSQHLKRVRGMRALHEAVMAEPIDCTNESSMDCDWSNR